MFTTKGLFSSIPCPNRERCLLPRCIFGHAQNKAEETVHLSLPKTETIATQEKEGEGRRKRRKLNEDHEAGLCQAEWTDVSKSQNGDDEVAKARRSKSQNNPKSVTRPISPPPLRNEAERDAVNQTASRGHNHQNVTSNPAPRTPKPEKKTPSKQVKKETLNPRILQNAPASHELRYKLVKALYEHLVRLNTELAKDSNNAEEGLVLSDQELITMALDMEERGADTPNIYSNVVKNTIMLMKKMPLQQWKEERASDAASTEGLEVAANLTPIGKSTDPPKPAESGLSLQEELALLPKFYTPIEKHADHGYVVSIPTEAQIAAAKAGVEAARGYEVCDRCKTRFQVFPGRREEDGVLATGGKCTYHYGKAMFPDRSSHDQSNRGRRYRCCGQVLGESSGCTRAENHVFKISDSKRLASVLNFASVPTTEGAQGIMTPVCIDGEMSYTVYGLELVRLTATTWPDYKELLDVLVRPVGEFLDLNSRYSGVWPADIADALPYNPGAPTVGEVDPNTNKRKLRIVSSPAQARDLLFSFLTPSTPIIGHGLENDLNATRIVHPTLIDTALLYPHKAGLPFRNGLKNLMSQYLGKNIQVVVDGKMEGHDSKEDANAAGELVKYKLVKGWEEMKLQGWRCENEVFIGPTGQKMRDFAVDMGGKKRGRGELEDGEGEG